MNAATGMPVFDAREDFACARRAAHVARLARWLGADVVAEGRHRVSVAGALGHRDIDARVTLAWDARARRTSPGGAPHGQHSAPAVAPRVGSRPAA